MSASAGSNACGCKNQCGSKGGQNLVVKNVVGINAIIMVINWACSELVGRKLWRLEGGNECRNQ